MDPASAASIAGYLKFSAASAVPALNRGLRHNGERLPLAQCTRASGRIYL